MIRSARPATSFDTVPLTFLLLLLSSLIGCSQPVAPTVAPTDAAATIGPREVPDLQITRPMISRSADALRAAIEAAGDGETIRVPAGHYLLRSEVVISRPLTVIGEDHVVFELAEGISQSAIRVGKFEDGGWSPVADVHIENIDIIGNGSSQRAGSGVVLLNARNCSLENSTVVDCFEDGVYLSGASGCVMENLVLLRNGRNGLAFGEAILETSTGNTIRGCRAAGNGLVGFDGEPVANTRFIDCVSTDNLTNGFMIGAEERSHDNAIIGCKALHNGYSGCAIWANDNRIERSLIAFNQRTGVTIMGPAAHDNVVLECTVKQNGWHGLLLDRSTRAQVLGNRIEANALDERGDGVAVVSPIDVYGNRIVGNTIRGATHDYAIAVTQRVWQTEIRDNDVEGLVILNGR